eukprot:CAMPEP_0175514506 /NCGR_PEP_ID=MMETSP0096-20121207/13461_1 /TAXON_ID=311494 /ORGANISM="Alexandrium monilatum, Strain CCMP3105" /LENGTH=345 /DNA_ID=CAMNT_0016816759 /DNA_START=8 /DNA_END=1046 /DNA_ORIENTATION=-
MPQAHHSRHPLTSSLQHTPVAFGDGHGGAAVAVSCRARAPERPQRAVCLGWPWRGPLGGNRGSACPSLLARPRGALAAVQAQAAAATAAALVAATASPGVPLGAKAKGLRRLTAVERAQAELMWMAARRKVELASSGHGGPDLKEAAGAECGGAVGSTCLLSRQAREAEAEASLVAACHSGNPDGLRRAIAKARAAGLVQQTKQAMALLGKIMDRRDVEDWRAHAAHQLQAAMAGEVHISGLEDAINRAWHAGVEKAALDEAIALYSRAKRRASRRLRKVHEALEHAVRSRDRAALRRVAAEASQAGLRAEALVANDVLAEEEQEEEGEQRPPPAADRRALFDGC